MSNPFFETEENGEDISVTGITEDGLKTLTAILTRYRAGDDVENIRDDFHFNEETFRIFMITCDLIGATEVVEKVLKDNGL